MSDDSHYSDGQLDIHFDSDVDTAEFLQTDTDNETDDDTNNDEDSVTSDNENNSSTTCYFQSLLSSNHFTWFFFLSLILALKTFYTYCVLSFKALQQSVWTSTSFWFLLSATLFWDTLYLYFDPEAPQGPFTSRTMRRKLAKQKHLPLRSFSKSWLLLSFYMLSFSTSSSPFSSITSALSQNYSRLVTLHDLLDFTPSTHFHYSCYCYDELLALRTPYPTEESASITEEPITFSTSQALEEPASIISEEPASITLEEPLSTLTSTTTAPFVLEELLSQPKLALPNDPEHFFLPYSSLTEMRGDMDQLDFHLTTEPSFVDTQFDFQALNEPHHHIFANLFQQERSSSITSTAYTALTASRNSLL